MTMQELTDDMARAGQPAYRAKQLYQWMHEKLSEGFSEMSNLPAGLRAWCEETYTYTRLSPVKVLESKLDGTRKYLFALADGDVIESVLMRYAHGNSVCISTQAGCRMGCKFCASTLNGLSRDLSPSEMLEQIYAIRRDTGERVSNVVLMGTGEPLDNFENVLRFIRLLTGEGGQHISQRNLTLSTCGLAPQIRRLAQEHLQITLALSLHAATDEKRQGIMPIAQTYSIRELMQACAFYFQETGRRITFEYSLIAGVNDSRQDAAGLAALAGPLSAHVNLIPVNPVKERGFQRSAPQGVADFQAQLERKGINATVRRELGKDIDGACGQLRMGYRKERCTS